MLATSTEALLLEHDYPTPRLWRVRVNDVFPTESGEGAQLKEMGFTDETACTLALDAAGGDVATAMGALVG